MSLPSRPVRFRRLTRRWLATLALGSLLLAAVLPSVAAANAADSLASAELAAGDAFLPATTADLGPEPRIVGGVEVDPPGKYPFMAALVEHGGDAFWDQYCGGSVIAADWVLTAAHCMTGETASTVDVVIGRHDLRSSTGERIRAAQIIIHPGWDEVTKTNDLALIRLAAPTAFTPIALPADGSFETAGTLLTAIGWGNTQSIPEWPYTLREVQVPVVGDAACRSAYSGYIDPPTAVDICAGDLEDGGIDTCQGDSGGPLFASTSTGFFQVGITSRSEGCALPGYPGIYTRVSALTTWITNQTGVEPVPVEPAPLCFGVPATIVGTARGETLYGTAGNDVIVGLAGGDTIIGYDGDDLICGGGGNDTITPGPGLNRVQGGPGNDVVEGGPRRDVVRGGDGDDILRGNGGPDRLFGGLGNDRLEGGTHNDYLDGGPGNDYLDGGLDDDILEGGLGTDTCYGETRNTCELPGTALDFGSGNVHLPVSDTQDAISTISVGSTGTITDLNIGLEITHTYVGDLLVILTHVNTGTAVTLIDHPGTTDYSVDFGCYRSNIDATLDDEAAAFVETMCLPTIPTISGSVRPNHPLAAFDGEDMGGTWRLKVIDEATLDSGFLEEWSLHFQT